MQLTVRTPSASQTGQPIVADTASLKRLARDLARVAPEAAKGFGKGMKGAGEVIAADARGRVSYSKRIPASIKVLAARGNVRVRAGGEAAPNAAPIENKGKGFVRHPVFLSYDELPGPSGRWTEKNSHPAFLGPALEATGAQVVELVEEALYTAVAAAIER